MRTYDPRRAKSNRSYTLLQIAELFDIHIATVRAWVKAGLPLIDSQIPHPSSPQNATANT